MVGCRRGALVHPSVAPSLIVGLPTFIIFSLKTCLNFLPSLAAAASAREVIGGMGRGRWRGEEMARSSSAALCMRSGGRRGAATGCSATCSGGARTVGSLDDELGREDVGELGTVAVASARRLLLVVVEVGAGEQVACGWRGVRATRAEGREAAGPRAQQTTTVRGRRRDGAPKMSSGT